MEHAGFVPLTARCLVLRGLYTKHISFNKMLYVHCVYVLKGFYVTQDSLESSGNVS